MTISEVSKQYELTPDTLRYYEKIGLLDPVSRSESGLRNYGTSDLRRIEFVRCMRAAGLSIEFLKLYVQLFNQGESTIPQRKEILETQKEVLLAKMNDMQTTLDRLNFKIQHYDDIMVEIEQNTASVLDSLE